MRRYQQVLEGLPSTNITAAQRTSVLVEGNRIAQFYIGQIYDPTNLDRIGVTDNVVTVTGGLATDKGLVAALNEELAKMKGVEATVASHPDSIHAGAIGAALWGAFRFEKLAASGQLLKAS